MLCMVYRATLVPGRRDEYIKEFARISEEVRRQKGCISYDLYVDSTDPRFDNKKMADSVVILEKWDCLEDLQEHSRSTVMTEFKTMVKDIKVTADYDLLAPVCISNSMEDRL